MAKIKKGNRILNVDNGRLDSYLSQGYDRIDEAGKVITRATGGKTVAVGEYNRALDEVVDLKEENDQLKKEVSKLKKELAALKKEDKKQDDKKEDKEGAK
ncbi:hypothetical protein [Shouchella hunanensis]|uniref:Phage protein n=1 Tax=Shouchella hunanensis TaxID=766894 RepID=A0ABY7W629_9BACI|nr:hypothetical protein [Shouchella hunanensis]RQW19895.1 hypothetical protein EH196_07040 [Bacillus sp. C1-1]WDF02951.1 hypothetical protein PQ477_15805 [Shouchella hunanensis]